MNIRELWLTLANYKILQMFGNVLHRVLPIFGSLLTAFFAASRQEVETWKTDKEREREESESLGICEKTDKNCNLFESFCTSPNLSDKYRLPL